MVRRMTEASLDFMAVQRQRRRDLTFLGVLGLLLFTAALAVVQAAYPPRPETGAAAGGEVRPVNPATLRRQIRSGRLSSHPAEHWRPAPRGAGRAP